MARVTKAYSFDSSQKKWFDMVAKDAARQRPKVPESQMMVEIIRQHYEHKKLVLDLNKQSMSSALSGGGSIARR